MPPENGSTRREELLAVATKLFAARGYHPTSLRAVTRAAKVNLAAVHYHFGSKQSLLEAVIARRLGPLNTERQARLDQHQQGEDRQPRQHHVPGDQQDHRQRGKAGEAREEVVNGISFG